MSKLRILLLTDLHVKLDLDIKSLEKITRREKIDLIVVAGDLTTYGTVNQVKRILEDLSEIELPIFYVPGNMDPKDSTDISFQNVHPLHGRIEYFQGYNFLGLGASTPTPFSTPFTMPESEVNDILENAKEQLLSDDPLVLISHNPPYDTEADIVGSQKHVGSKSVREFIEKEKPIAILCGHIHESQAICEIQNTLCVNPGAGAHRNAAIIELEKSESGSATVTAKLITF
ncbi:MAG TPA: metallophosphoesterase [Candidatus Bathyarchaeia archaeon]|nr:metallophosphoesterase [Candidatus Bathyarchaeia archaeon]